MSTPMSPLEQLYYNAIQQQQMPQQNGGYNNIPMDYSYSNYVNSPQVFQTEKNQYDQQLHYPDSGKLPWHDSFATDSSAAQNPYFGGLAGQWTNSDLGWQYIPSFQGIVSGKQAQFQPPNQFF